MIIVVVSCAEKESSSPLFDLKVNEEIGIILRIRLSFQKNLMCINIEIFTTEEESL